MQKLLKQFFVPVPVDREVALSLRLEKQARRRKVSLPKGFRPLRKPNDYLKMRGVRADTILEWELGVAGDYVVAPARTEKDLIGWVSRAMTPGREPRCDMPHAVHDFVLGYKQTASRVVPREVVLVEGMFDALKVWQAGFPVIAILGRASVARRQFVHALGRPLCLFPDADDGGNNFLDSLAPLAATRLLRVATCPLGRGDPADCTVKEIRGAVNRAVRQYYVKEVDHAGKTRTATA